MWNNIGHKLQSLAIVVCWLGIIGSIIWGVAIITQNNNPQPTILTGIIYLVIGCLASWIGSWALYGLGLVVEYVEKKGEIPSFSNTSSGNTSSIVSDTNTAPFSQNPLTPFAEVKKQNKEMTENYIVCPDCNHRSSKDYIKANKKCPKCGKELL